MPISVIIICNLKYVDFAVGWTLQNFKKLQFKIFKNVRLNCDSLVEIRHFQPRYRPCNFNSTMTSKGQWESLKVWLIGLKYLPIEISHWRTQIKSIPLTSCYSRKTTWKFQYLIGLKACNLMKQRLQHRCFPVNIAKFSRTAFLIEHLGWLLSFVTLQQLPFEHSST